MERPTSRRPSEPPSIGSTGADLTTAWRAHARRRELPSPDSEPLEFGAQSVALVWRAHYVAALFAESSELAAKLEDKGFEVVFLGENEASWPDATSVLAKLLGRST